jgi:prepilin-type N-terminal cleavage/methylation domain-containing protein
MRARGGFTLIELTVALAILVIASGMLIMRVVGGSSRQALHSSARNIGNAIRVWRERARAEETTYHLVCDDRDYRILSGKEVVRRGRLGGGEAFEGTGPVTITFTPRGALPPTSISLRNQSGERITLILGALVNEIEYQEAR